MNRDQKSQGMTCCPSPGSTTFHGGFGCSRLPDLGCDETRSKLWVATPKTSPSLFHQQGWSLGSRLNPSRYQVLGLDWKASIARRRRVIRELTNIVQMPDSPTPEADGWEVLVHKLLPKWALPPLNQNTRY